MRVFGLIGYPLGHSFSKVFFTRKFLREQIAAKYEIFPIETLDKLPEIFEDNVTLTGLNVTIPFKEKIIPYLHQIEPEARKIGAVNTIRVEHIYDEIQLTGFNTDVLGFELSLAPILLPHLSKALILGSGGASKSVCYVLDKLNISWKIVSRSPENKNMIPYSALTAELINSCKLIINTTPLGMYPNTETYPDIPYEAVSSEHLLFDLVYNPEITLFMKKGMEQGARVKNGLEMLEIQAEKAWEIWNEK
jgi:shikimate dehydrogenase